MFSTEVSLVIIILLLFGWLISLWRNNKALKNENNRLMKKTGEYEVMKDDAREQLKTHETIKTIKLMREKYNLSLVEAKNLVDSVKVK